MSEKAPIPELPRFAAFTILLALTVIMFGDVLFTANDTVVSLQGADLFRQFVYWRDFGFHEIMRGNLPLWNPHLFSGAPFLGGFQSALLYPPNFIHLILPLAKAINVGVALHVLLIGFFTYLWTAYHGLHSLACLLSAVLVMFSGSYFLHITAGHLPNLCAMAWTPLLLLAVDGIFRKPGLPWGLLGALALTMQILAGHPQYVYYTGLTIIPYAVVRLVASRHRLQALIGIAGMGIGAVCLAAVQIASGIDASGESIRSIGVPIKFAAMFSFPPEGLVSFVAPYFFGDMTHLPYWGRGYLWEMCPFIGVTGLALAIIGISHGKHGLRIACCICSAILVVFALGAHTPLFSLLYRWLPGYAFFRGSAKFIFFVTLFLAALAGTGLDYLIRNRQPRKLFAAVTTLAGVFLGVAAAFLLLSPFEPHSTMFWRRLIEIVAASHESYLPMQIFTDVTFIREAALFAAKGLLIAAVVCFLVSFLLLLRGSFPKAIYLIALLAMIELFAFAKTASYSFDLTSAIPPALASFYRSHPGDFRVLNTGNADSAMSLGTHDIWGYDPGIPLRYARFIAFTQGYDPECATQYITFHKYHPLYTMLRCRFVIVPHHDKIRLYEMPDAMPHLLLLKEWRMITERTLIFREMEKQDFDPRKTVILEDAPDPQPKANHTGEYGSFLVSDSSTDHLTITANLPEPAILLITDSYSRGWQTKALRGSAQQDYRVMPANYTLMAIPLAAGNHHFRLEYKPLAFVAGKWVSFISLIVYTVLITLCIRKKIKRGKSRETENHQNN